MTALLWVVGVIWLALSAYDLWLFTHPAEGWEDADA